MFKSSCGKFWEDNLIKPEFFIKENFVVFKTYYNEDSACYEEQYYEIDGIKDLRSFAEGCLCFISFYYKPTEEMFKFCFGDESVTVGKEYEEFKAREKSKDKCIDTILKAKNMRTMGCEYADL